MNSLFFGGFNKKIIFSVFSDYLVGNLALIQTIVFKKRSFRGF
ncbi:hypothetical protein HPHPP3_1402 [Helicobacter pylori Hp P-3]|nr:hypothetical protein HPHPP3_1402 [Helicobacter pylori Hp P-3]EJC56499.1 hypothetical protein HPHPP3B_1308 [Helicobacter pylori Hp P-3b]